MNPDLLFDFAMDKENSAVLVTREFAAPVALVWNAWTTAEMLDKWWAPKPYRAETKTLEFKVGGHWLYAMVGPESDKIWCRADYLSIDSQKSFSASSAFCDESGKVSTDFPVTTWHNSFTQEGNKTKVTIRLQFDSVMDMEKYIELGFKEGFTMALGNLDELFAG